MQTIVYLYDCSIRVSCLFNEYTKQILILLNLYNCIILNASIISNSHIHLFSEISYGGTVNTSQLNLNGSHDPEEVESLV